MQADWPTEGRSHDDTNEDEAHERSAGQEDHETQNHEVIHTRSRLETTKLLPGHVPFFKQKLLTFTRGSSCHLREDINALCQQRTSDLD
eukprot:3934546-Rhodomonas_salina.1